MTEFQTSERPDADRIVLGAPIQAPRARLDGIDLLRGLVIVIMALDHVKGNFLRADYDLVDLSRTSTWYFLTRWASHFCAPTFVFLAGTGAFLYGARGKTKGQLTWFLISRGIWLIFLELTVIRFSWWLEPFPTIAFGQVIWAIGWSMIVLAGLIYLPISFITTFGIAMIAFHNLFDNVRAEDWGDFGWLWNILHVGRHTEIQLHWDGWQPTVLWRLINPGEPPTAFNTPWFHPFYPLIPWIGVLAAGYGFGAMMLLDRSRRRKEIFGLGLALTLGFIALRYTNVYGDRLSPNPNFPGPWSEREDWIRTLLSFINTQKYPPSLSFLLMTLGPALMALAFFDREPGLLGRFFIIYGRVPLFFYLLHWYVIKGLAFAFAHYNYGRSDWLYGDWFTRGARSPSDNLYDMWTVYAVWAFVVLSLFPLCYWFAGVKRRSKAAWLSYL